MSRRLGFFIVAVIALVTVFFNLGGIPLLDPDEPVYAETPKEMLLFNDFVSPRIYGEFWYDKPPMYYWLVAGAFKLFGINEFAARFPSALLAVVCVLFVYYYGCRLFNDRAALAGALVLVTSIEYFYMSKAAVTDITLTLCLTVSLLAFLVKQYYVFYLFAALATVTKGPIGFLFPGAIIFLYFLITHKWYELKTMKIPTGLLLYLVVAIPWYWAMYSLHGSAFIDTFIGFNNITRFTSPEHPEGRLWYYFIPVLILGFFPWTALMLQSVWVSLTDSRSDFSVLLFLNIWAAFIFAFFTISQTKLVSYILPMYPPLAMVVGWYLERLWDHRRSIRNLSWPVITTILTALLVAGMAMGLKKMPALKSGAAIAAAIFILMAAAVWYYAFRRKYAGAFWAQVLAMVLFSLVLVSMLFPAAAPYFTTREIARDFTNIYDGSSPVYIVKFLHPGFTFYSNIYGTELKTESDLTQAVAKQEKAYFIVRDSDYKRLEDGERQKLMVLATAADKILAVKK